MAAKTVAHKPKARSDVALPIRALCLAAAVGVLLLCLTLLGSTAFCLQTDQGYTVLTICAYGCCTVSAFAAGCVAGKLIGKSGLVNGLLAALAQIVALLIVCLALCKGVGSGFALASALTLVCGATGGVVAVNLRRRRRYK